MDTRQILSGLIRTLNRARVQTKNPKVTPLINEALDLTIKDFKESPTRSRSYGNQPRDAAGRFLRK